MPLQGDYAFFLQNARKIVLLPIGTSLVSLLVARWTLPLHLAAVAVTLLSAWVLGRPSLNVRRFLLSANASYSAPLLSLSILIAVLALEDLGAPLRQHAYQIAGFFLVFTAGSLVIFLRVWADRRRRFQSEAHDHSLALETALALLTDSGRISPWGAGAGAALIIAAVALSAWMGPRFGLDTQALPVCIVFFIVWVLIVGGLLAQVFTIARHPAFASITLYRETP